MAPGTQWYGLLEGARVPFRSALRWYGLLEGVKLVRAAAETWRAVSLLLVARLIVMLHC